MEDRPHSPPAPPRLLAAGGLALVLLAVALLAGGRSAEPAAAPGSPAPADPAPSLEAPPPPLEGRVVDARTRRPIAAASVHAGSREIRTGPDGRFTLPAPAVPLLVKAPGYERRSVGAAPPSLTVALEPKVIRAAYLTYYGIGHHGIRERVFGLLERTELNGVVIDVKGDRGWIPYRTEVPLAREAGAQGPVLLRDFDQLLADLKAKGVYTIARIVVFKDNVLAQHRPEWAVRDARTGQPWTDLERLPWMDPFREEVWDYAIAVAREAARKGFDEIQFDYLRFPGDGKVSAARFSRPNRRDTRLGAITGFLERARRALAPTGVFLAADIFGYTAFNGNDSDIGQRVEELAPHVDYLSPMVYPSSYHLGIPGHRVPVAAPYEVVLETVRLVRKRAAPAPTKIRPWLQNFRDYAFDRRPFGVTEIRAQIRGATEGGALGWMLWNPRNVYTEAALRPSATTGAETVTFPR